MLLIGRGGIDSACLIVGEEVVIGIRRIKCGSDRIHTGVADRSGRQSLDRTCVVSVIVYFALSLADNRSDIIADIERRTVAAERRIIRRMVKSVVNNRRNNLHLIGVCCLFQND